mmetsp:Transcript_11324/g.29089  ORF Transcript_11324/g.29089 Transcript_11324/m.29089 type:complete len:322 (-) Transcript_11324:291-1256(-)
MRQDDASVDIHLILEVHVLADNAAVLHTAPLADAAVPPHDAVEDLGEVLRLCARHEHAVPQAHTVANDAVLPDRDVRADEAAIADLHAGIDQHVPLDVAARRKLLRLLVPHGRQVQGEPGEVVLRLAHVHPVPGKGHREQLLVLRNLRKHLLLDGGRLQLNAVQHAGAQHVDAGVDLIANKGFGLLHKAVHQACSIGDHHAVLGGIIHLCNEQGAFCVVCFVKLHHLFQRVLAYDIAVQHKERLAAAIVQKVPRDGERPGGAHGLLLLAAYDADSDLVLPLGDELLHHCRAIVDSQDHFVHTRLFQSLDLMYDHGLVCKIH